MSKMGLGRSTELGNIALVALFHNSCDYITNNEKNPQPRDHIFSGIIMRGKSGDWELQGFNYHSGAADIESKIGARKTDKTILVPVDIANAQRMIDLRDAYNALYKNGLAPNYFSPSMSVFSSKEVKETPAIHPLGFVHPPALEQKPEEYQVDLNASDGTLFPRARANCTTMTSLLFEVAGIGANNVVPNLKDCLRGAEANRLMSKHFAQAVTPPWDRNLGLPDKRSDLPRTQITLNPHGKIMLTWPDAVHVTLDRQMQVLNQRTIGGLKVADELVRGAAPPIGGRPRDVPDYFIPAIVRALETGVRFSEPQQHALGIT